MQTLHFVPLAHVFKFTSSTPRQFLGGPLLLILLIFQPPWRLWLRNLSNPIVTLSSPNLDLGFSFLFRIAFRCTFRTTPIAGLLGIFLRRANSALKKFTTVDACWFIRKVHHYQSSSPPLKLTSSFIESHHCHQGSLSSESNIHHNHCGSPTLRKDHQIPIFGASRSSYSVTKSPFSFG